MEQQNLAGGQPEREVEVRPGIRVQRRGHHLCLCGLAGWRKAAQRALAGRHAAGAHTIQAPQLEAGGPHGYVVAAQRG